MTAEVAMRFWLFALGFVACAGGAVSPAAAQNYPWCAYYRIGGTNCGFSTFDQCAAAVSGVGGSCMENSQYQGAAAKSHAPSRTPSRPEQPKPKPKLVAPQPQ